MFNNSEQTVSTFARLFKVGAWKSLAFLAVSCLLATACQTEALPTPDPQDSPPTPLELQSERIEVGVDKPFTLSAGESMALADASLYITFEMVEEDGRCPSAVTCVESGPVVIVVSAVLGDQPLTTFTMNPDPELAALSGNPPNTHAYQGYEIILTAVNPYPEQPEDILNMPYTATFFVR